jgi:uncharacterized protein YbaA (DUF1428 family)
MPYVDGFVTPVPTANKEAYTLHATEAAELFRRLGATRMVEAWGDDVPDGKLNDLKKAVQAKPDETVLFSWIEYPDEATGKAAGEKMMNDPQANEMMKDMPFDGSRMIYASFDSILEEGAGGKPGYVDGFVVAVPQGKKDAYLAMAQKAAAMFEKHGALRVVETWSVDVPEGKVTDYNRATLREDGENVVYSWIEWPDKDTRVAAWEKIMADPSMQPGDDMPFDGKRMMWGGFVPVLDEKLA